MALSPEEILLRWFNYQLEQANHPRRVQNFGGDIKDSVCYTVLLNQIAPEESGVDLTPLQVLVLEYGNGWAGTRVWERVDRYRGLGMGGREKRVM